MEYKIPLFWPYITHKTKQAVNDVLDTRWVGQGPKVDEFEKAMGDKFNIRYPLMTNSGTSALELAYDLIGIKKGDEVITTPLTCTATNIPLLRRGAKLIFADIDDSTLCISQNSVDKLITDKTKAIVNVNLGGIKNIITTSKNIPIVTDSAQAIGYTNGDYVIYSFQAIKHFTTGDGGMLCLPNGERYKEAKLKRWFGIDRDKKRSYDWQAYKEREMTFDIEHLGYKYQPTDISAAMGLAGLKDYDEIIEHRRTIFNIYKSKLDGLEGIRIVDGEENLCWLATFLVDDRDQFSKVLSDAGIETNLVQVRNDIYNIFGGKRQDLPFMNRIEHQYISIPIHHKVSFDDALYIVNAIKKGYHHEN